MRNDIAKIYLKARNDFGTRYNDEYCTMIRNLFIKKTCTSSLSREFKIA